MSRMTIFGKNVCSPKKETAIQQLDSLFRTPRRGIQLPTPFEQQIRYQSLQFKLDGLERKKCIMRCAPVIICTQALRRRVMNLIFFCSFIKEPSYFNLYYLICFYCCQSNNTITTNQPPTPKPVIPHYNSTKEKGEHVCKKKLPYSLQHFNLTAPFATKEVNTTTPNFGTLYTSTKT